MNLLEVSQVSAISYFFFFNISTCGAAQKEPKQTLTKQSHGERVGKGGSGENANTDNDRQRRQLPQP